MMSQTLRKRVEAVGRRGFATPDAIRTRFSSAMSCMYRQEVPQYGALLDLVAEINASALQRDPSLLAHPADSTRLDMERHGAIRLGTPRELSTIRRIFAVMGMHPVGYYDLTVAGVPVHSTAFRPVDGDSLAANPFRVFTSLLRLDLVRDQALRDLAAGILSKRNIFSGRTLALIDQAEAAGGLTDTEADEFVGEVLHTFRWHGEAAVSRDTYERLHDAHRLIADVVGFKGPHINHLTPRTLDIDAAQAQMPLRGISSKETIEGPPRRKVPILLRQTSFKAVEESVRFAGGEAEGAHTARFGEIEQRGIALTRKGRTLYDALLNKAPDKEAGDESNYQTWLARAFEAFPDDENTLRREGLGFFSYALATNPAAIASAPAFDLGDLVTRGVLTATPITYEDFLPVSAAGIFQSNLGDGGPATYSAVAAQSEFERALGAPVLDEIALYQAEQDASIARVTQELKEVDARC
jgi:uncharacterized glyoxalase superfamily metalloenzyme YdcJ